jgi:hypothetical protein
MQWRSTRRWHPQSRWNGIYFSVWRIYVAVDKCTNRLCCVDSASCGVQEVEDQFCWSDDVRCFNFLDLHRDL